MQVSILNIPSEILFQTVTITNSKTAPDNIFIFHCYHCGTGISKIKGEIVKISAGKLPTNDTRVIQQCHRCKENYSFVTLHTSPTVTKLSLTNEIGRTVSTFHCVICRIPLVQYMKEDAVSLPEMKPLVLPTLIDCPQCFETYLLNEVVGATM